MKFGKLFKEQMVPEWTEAYMDYSGLKRVLREISHSQNGKQPVTNFRGLQQKLSLHESTSGLNLRSSNRAGNQEVRDQIISINEEEQDESRQILETNFLKQPEVGNAETEFFKKLDEDFGRVNEFFKDEVKAVMNEAALLDKQLDALFALRMKVVNPDLGHSRPNTYLPADTEIIVPLQGTLPTRVGSPGEKHTGMIYTKEGSNTFLEAKQSDIGLKASPSLLTDFTGDCNNETATNIRKKDPPNILEYFMFSNLPDSAISTVKGIFRSLTEVEIRYRRRQLRKAEQQLRLAFIEFYQKLCFLTHYSFANLSAFSKIMKKYEKITSRRVASLYMKTVKNSFLDSSNELRTLLESVEATFIKHFSNSNRREGMKSLRRKAKMEKHSVTFFSGLYFGCGVALLVAIIINLSAHSLAEKGEGTSYVENTFPLYSFFVYIFLHILTYAANIYYWRRYRVNYPFIFGFKQGTELSYWEVLLIGTALSVLAMASFLINLHLDMDYRSQHYTTFIQLIPLGLITVVLVILFCPFDIVYRSSRFFFVKSIFHCFCAPLYKVTFADSFLADQLTSQVQAMRCLELYVCYYGMGELHSRQKKCRSHGVYNAFYFIVALIPYWLRFLQCLRSFCENRDAIHVYNSLKYFLTIVAVLTRTAYELKKGMKWMVIALISSAIATVISTIWDIVMDWGLLQKNPRNFGLRDKLSISHRSVYFAAMVLNVVLRIAWLQLVLEFNLHTMYKITITATVSCLEILRRGIWSFFRLENEHQNNVAKYRAVKSIPLPFQLS